MTISEFMSRLVKQFPRHAAQIEAWEDDYRRMLSPHQGEALAGAWNRVIDAWGADTKAAFPKPADFARHCKSGVAYADFGAGQGFWEYLREHVAETAEKCAADARDRCIALHGEDVANHVASFIRWHSGRIANYYVQRRYRAQKDDRYMNGARWKFTDQEIAELASRAETQAALAANNERFTRRTA